MVNNSWKKLKESLVEQGWKECKDCDGVVSPMIEDAGTIKISRKGYKNNKKAK